MQGRGKKDAKQVAAAAVLEMLLTNVPEADFLQPGKAKIMKIQVGGLPLSLALAICRRESSLFYPASFAAGNDAVQGSTALCAWHSSCCN